MFEEEFDIATLLAAQLHRQLTPEEQSALDSWLSASTKRRTWHSEMMQSRKVRKKLREFNSADRDAVWRKTLIGLETKYPKPETVKKMKLRPGIGAVAAAITLIVLGIYFFDTRNPIVNLNAEIVNQNDIAPGKNTATLTLANGKMITLSDEKTGVVIDAAKLSYIDGSSVLSSGASAKDLGSYKAGMTVLQTPRAGQYQMVLPDGTKLWLNAASSIRFPSSFEGLKQRKVYIQGEVCFEVAKDKNRPFIVECAGQTLEVLGTQFNISAYPEDSTVKTTLLEGSLRVAYRYQNVLLKPNQQAHLSASGIQVKDVNAIIYTSWKDGIFTFQREQLTSIMNKLSRWYDVDVVYHGTDYETVTYSGSISRQSNISSILKLLEANFNIRFKLEGRKVIVLPNN